MLHLPKIKNQNKMEKKKSHTYSLLALQILYLFWIEHFQENIMIH